MVLQRWDPFRDLRRMEMTVDRLWRGHRPHANGSTSDAESWAIPLDVVRDGEAVVVRASIPGVKPEDVKVTIDESVLTVTGHTETEQTTEQGTYLMRERRTGSFRRSLRLPDSVDAEKAVSTYEAGVLTVTLPKIEAKKAKQLTVEVKDASEKALSEAA